MWGARGMGMERFKGPLLAEVGSMGEHHLPEKL
jgi:hypothetical protein